MLATHSEVLDLLSSYWREDSKTGKVGCAKDEKSQVDRLIQNEVFDLMGYFSVVLHWDTFLAS